MQPQCYMNFKQSQGGVLQKSGSEKFYKIKKNGACAGVSFLLKLQMYSLVPICKGGGGLNSIFRQISSPISLYYVRS